MATRSAMPLLLSLVHEGTLLCVSLLHPSAPSAVYVGLFLLAHQGSLSPFASLRVLAAIATATVALVLRFSMDGQHNSRLVSTSGDAFYGDAAVLLESCIYGGSLAYSHWCTASRARSSSVFQPVDTWLCGPAARRGVTVIAIVFASVAATVQPCALGLPILLFICSVAFKWAAHSSALDGFAAVIEIAISLESLTRAYVGGWLLTLYLYQLRVRHITYPPIRPDQSEFNHSFDRVWVLLRSLDRVWVLLRM